MILTDELAIACALNENIKSIELFFFTSEGARVTTTASETVLFTNSLPSVLGLCLEMGRCSGKQDDSSPVNKTATKAMTIYFVYSIRFIFNTLILHFRRNQRMVVILEIHPQGSACSVIVISRSQVVSPYFRTVI